MNRNLCLFAGLAAGLIVAGLATPREALSQLGYLVGVRLQSATPGTPDPGHANVSGTMRAGQFVGGGAGLTSVDADLLDGMNSTAFLQAIPNPLTLSGTSSTHIIRGQNASTTNFAPGVFGYSTAATGSTYGIDGRSDSTSGSGVHGSNTAGTGTTYGGRFESFSTSGRGVSGAAFAATGTTYGVYGQNSSTDGRGVYGSATATTGSTYGGYFAASSANGTAVYGEANSPTGFNYGGRFRCSSPDGIAVFGESTSSSGFSFGVQGWSHSTNGRGVFGYATATNGTVYGVFGQASTASNGFGVYAFGDMGASGVKPLRIDHPFDPENKYLLHYASESPMPQNFYVGNVITDVKGYAWVELPDYFEEINTNCKYQLTVVDDADYDGFVMAKVSKKVRGSRFQIRTSAPNVEVSWEVKADRNDLYVRHKKPKDVVEKQDLERGKYQHPEFYGMPQEMGMNYQREPMKPKVRR